MTPSRLRLTSAFQRGPVRPCSLMMTATTPPVYLVRGRLLRDIEKG